MRRNSVFDGLRASRFADIQSETILKTDCMDWRAEWIFAGLKER